MERRRHVRSRVVEVGRIDTGASALTSCIIRDRTAFGARIMVADAQALPDRILLVIYPAASTTWARVVWRGEGLCGVEFLPDPIEPPGV
jgi:hypothetical protein